jgi:hypothetical protein
MLPLIIHERETSRFYYYQDGVLQTGIRYKCQMYRLVETFGAGDHTHASLLGRKLSEQGDRAIVTVNAHCCRVWAAIHAGVPSRR